MKANKAIRNKMQAALTASGFKREFKSNGCAQYSAEANGRRVNVQIWDTGLCRASHGTVKLIDGKPNLHETTEPTEFATVKAMHAAIRNEWTRVSSPPNDDDAVAHIEQDCAKCFGKRMATINKTDGRANVTVPRRCHDVNACAALLLPDFKPDGATNGQP